MAGAQWSVAEEILQHQRPEIQGAGTEGQAEAEQLALLASDGMLVKRPILMGDDFVLVGFRENEWAAALGIRTDA